MWVLLGLVEFVAHGAGALSFDVEGADVSLAVGDGGWYPGLVWVFEVFSDIDGLLDGDYGGGFFVLDSVEEVFGVFFGDGLADG